jgi:hypothetical protein
MVVEEFIGLVPNFSFHDWLVLAGIAGALVTNLADKSDYLAAYSNFQLRWTKETVL